MFVFEASDCSQRLALQPMSSFPYLPAPGYRETMAEELKKGLEWVEGHWRRPKGSIPLPNGRLLTPAEASRRRQLKARCKALQEASKNPPRFAKKSGGKAGSKAEEESKPSEALSPAKTPPLSPRASLNDAFIVFSDTESDTEAPPAKSPRRPPVHLRSDPLRDLSVCEHCGCDSAHIIHLSDSPTASQPSRVQTALTSFGIRRM